MRRASDISALRSLYNNVSASAYSLESLGEDLDSYGGILVPIILGKLPEEIRVSWKRGRRRNQRDIEALLKFLDEEIDARDCRPITTDSYNSNSNSNVREESRRTTATALIANGASNHFKGILPCLFCNSTSHRSARCSIDINAKKEALRLAKRCFRCTKKGHK